MYRWNESQPPLKVIMDKASQITILAKAHKGLGYREEQAMFEIVRLQLFWPYLCANVYYHM